jgi:hypothetical protein
VRVLFDRLRASNVRALVATCKRRRDRRVTETVTAGSMVVLARTAWLC